MIGIQIERLGELRAMHEGMLASLNEATRLARSFQDKNRARTFQAHNLDGYRYSVLEVLLFSTQTVRSFRALRMGRNTPVPTHIFDQAWDASANLNAALNEILGSLRAIATDGRNLVTQSGSRLRVEETGEEPWNLTDSGTRIMAYTDQLLTAVSGIASIVGASQMAGNDQAAEVVRDEVLEVVQALDRAEDAAKEIEELLIRIRQTVSETNSRRTELLEQLQGALTEAEDEVEKLSGTVAGAADSATRASNDAAVATSKREELDRLAAQAQEAYKDISSFQANLEATRKRLRDAQSRTNELLNQFEQKNATVAEMITQAERMVSGSTVAGLAKAFGDEKKSLDDSMRGAFWGFITGIVLLFITSGALAAYILNIPIHGLEWLTKRGLSDPTLAQVLSRAVIVIAPFWLTLFSARRYRSLFDLRQQYSHKYNMAFSMEGFKNQAPSFAESIAAWVFTIVAANPVLPKSGTSMDTPPPLTVQTMVEDVRGMLEKIMGREGVK